MSLMMKSRCNRLLLSSLLALTCFVGELAGITARSVLCLPTVAGPPVDGEGTDKGKAAVQEKNSDSSSSESSGTTGGALQGSVATTEQTAEAILVELEQTVKHVEDASWGAFTEAQRPDVIFIGGPNVVGGAVIPAIGGNGAIGTGGYLPPRKKWIDYFAMHVNYLGPILKQELESFQLPPGVSSDTIEDYAEYSKIGGRLPDLCNKMLIACRGPKYDNMTITMAAGMLHEELKRYDKQRKLILRDIREDFKHTADDQEKKAKEARKEREKEEKEAQKQREEMKKDD